MTLATACSEIKDTVTAFETAYGCLCGRMDGDPDLLFLYFTEDHDPTALADALGALPPFVRVHGGTSCRGLMTEEALFLDNTAMGMMGMRFPGACFGTALQDKGADSRAAARDAVQAALMDAGRPGELPDLVLLAIAPSGEEDAIAGIADVLGSHVPVFGGSVADNASIGHWCVVTRHAQGRESLVVTVVFSDVPMSRSLRGSYAPSPLCGTVTAMDGPRVILRIDDVAADKVYAAWYKKHTGHALLLDETLLYRTALTPLGREVGDVGGIGVYALSHIWAIREDGGLEVLTDVSVGQKLRFMIGSRETLMARAGRTVESAMVMQGLDASTVSGALFSFCAGLVLTLGSDMRQVQEILRETMLGRPFLAPFTFGEQGSVLENRPIHGNLMISVLILGT
ncbi:MAG: FIST C-terminal domain-containing protein [Rhodospirillaceae bacterium]|nr:FIST C-terminal domain-containing protein [Rhodospirillaceae bacterium]